MRKKNASGFKGRKNRDLLGLVGLMPLGALYPSKSGLMNKHTVKHIVKIEIMGKIKCHGFCVGSVSCYVPCTHLNPDY